MIINVNVKPNSRTNELIYESSGLIKVKFTSPAESGKANVHLIKFLSSFFQIPQNRIEIISGLKSRRKILKIELPDEEVVKRLKSALKET